MIFKDNNTKGGGDARDKFAVLYKSVYYTLNMALINLSYFKIVYKHT